MEEWRLCVSNFETTAEFWAEVMTSDLFSLHDNITFDARVLEIKNFIHTKNQSQCRCPEALHELREMIIDFNILLAKLALKYLFAFVIRFFFNFLVISIGRLLLVIMINLSGCEFLQHSVPYLTYTILFLFYFWRYLCM